jgi:serine/threonine protein kinase
METKADNNALPMGYQLEEYRIQSILSRMAFSTTYLAIETQTDVQVVLKEYFPDILAVRKDDDTVQPSSQEEADNFAWGLEQFINNARILTQLNHPNIVRIQRFFEANNTVYLVMDYEQGQSLAERFKEGETATEEELMAMLPPLLAGLETVHQADYLHGNITPENIYLRKEDTSPVLIGLGGAHYDMGKRSVASFVTPGYAPFEQYQSKGNQGAWTDIYALGAVLYRMISGSTPVESTERIDAMVYDQTDPLTPAVEVGKGRYSEELLEAIDWALEARDPERPQSVAEWVEEIIPQAVSPTNSSHPLKSAVMWILGVVIVAIGLGGGYFFYTKGQTEKPSEDAPIVPKEVEKKQLPPLKQQVVEVGNEEIQQPPQIEELEEPSPPPIQHLAEPEEEDLTEPFLPEETYSTESGTFPEEPPVEQPFVFVEPDELIQDYYAGISDQQYDKTWLMLSDHFKEQHHCCNADGSYKKAAYLKWWKTIKKVEVLTTNLLEQNEGSATVEATLRYFKRRGRITDNTHTFKLVTNNANSWRIDDVK